MSRCSRDTTASLRHQALHTANILAVGSEEHREELMRASVEEHVMDAMSHSDPQMVVACLWLVINLLYTDMNQTSRSPAAAKVLQRSRKLASLGLVKKLEDLRRSEH